MFGVLLDTVKTQPISFGLPPKDSTAKDKGNGSAAAGNSGVSQTPNKRKNFRVNNKNAGPGKWNSNYRYVRNAKQEMEEGLTNKEKLDGEEESTDDESAIKDDDNSEDKTHHFNGSSTRNKPSLGSNSNPNGRINPDRSPSCDKQSNCRIYPERNYQNNYNSQRSSNSYYPNGHYQPYSHNSNGYQNQKPINRSWNQYNCNNSNQNPNPNYNSGSSRKKRKRHGHKRNFFPNNRPNQNQNSVNNHCESSLDENNSKESNSKTGRYIRNPVASETENHQANRQAAQEHTTFERSPSASRRFEGQTRFIRTSQISPTDPSKEDSSIKPTTSVNCNSNKTEATPEKNSTTVGSGKKGNNSPRTSAAKSPKSPSTLKEVSSLYSVDSKDSKLICRFNDTSAEGSNGKLFALDPSKASENLILINKGKDSVIQKAYILHRISKTSEPTDKSDVPVQSDFDSENQFEAEVEDQTSERLLPEVSTEQSNSVKAPETLQSKTSSGTASEITGKAGEDSSLAEKSETSKETDKEIGKPTNSIKSKTENPTSSADLVKSKPKISVVPVCKLMRKELVQEETFEAPSAESPSASSAKQKTPVADLGLIVKSLKDSANSPRKSLGICATRTNCIPNLVTRRKRSSYSCSSAEGTPITPKRPAQTENKSILDEIMSMDRSTIKQIINTAGTKYDEALRQEAQRRNSEDIRRQLKAFTQDKPRFLTVSDFLPDEFVDAIQLPDFLLNKIRSAIGEGKPLTDLLNITKEEPTETENQAFKANEGVPDTAPNPKENLANRSTDDQTLFNIEKDFRNEIDKYRKENFNRTIDMQSKDTKSTQNESQKLLQNNFNSTKESCLEMNKNRKENLKRTIEMKTKNVSEGFVHSNFNIVKNNSNQMTKENLKRTIEMKSKNVSQNTPSLQNVESQQNSTKTDDSSTKPSNLSLSKNKAENPSSIIPQSQATDQSNSNLTARVSNNYLSNQSILEASSTDSTSKCSNAPINPHSSSEKNSTNSRRESSNSNPGNSHIKPAQQNNSPQDTNALDSKQCPSLQTSQNSNITVRKETIATNQPHSSHNSPPQNAKNAEEDKQLDKLSEEKVVNQNNDSTNENGSINSPSNRNSPQNVNFRSEPKDMEKQSSSQIAPSGNFNRNSRFSRHFKEKEAFGSRNSPSSRYSSPKPEYQRNSSNFQNRRYNSRRHFYQNKNYSRNSPHESSTRDSKRSTSFSRISNPKEDSSRYSTQREYPSRNYISSKTPSSYLETHNQDQTFPKLGEKELQSRDDCIKHTSSSKSANQEDSHISSHPRSSEGNEDSSGKAALSKSHSSSQNLHNSSEAGRKPDRDSTIDETRMHESVGSLRNSPQSDHFEYQSVSSRKSITPTFSALSQGNNSMPVDSIQGKNSIKETTNSPKLGNELPEQNSGKDSANSKLKSTMATQNSTKDSENSSQSSTSMPTEHSTKDSGNSTQSKNPMPAQNLTEQSTNSPQSKNSCAAQESSEDCRNSPPLRNQLRSPNSFKDSRNSPETGGSFSGQSSSKDSRSSPESRSQLPALKSCTNSRNSPQSRNSSEAQYSTTESRNPLPATKSSKDLRNSSQSRIPSRYSNTESRNQLLTRKSSRDSRNSPPSRNQFPAQYLSTESRNQLSTPNSSKNSRNSPPSRKLFPAQYSTTESRNSYRSGNSPKSSTSSMESSRNCIPSNDQRHFPYNSPQKARNSTKRSYSVGNEGYRRKRKLRYKKKHKKSYKTDVIIIDSSSSSDSDSSNESDSSDSSNSESKSSDSEAESGKSDSSKAKLQHSRLKRQKLTAFNVVDTFERMLLGKLSVKLMNRYKEKFSNSIAAKLQFISCICTSEYNEKNFTKMEVAKIQHSLKQHDKQLALDFLLIEVVNVLVYQQQIAKGKASKENPKEMENAVGSNANTNAGGDGYRAGVRAGAADIRGENQSESNLFSNRIAKESKTNDNDKEKERGRGRELEMRTTKENANLAENHDNLNPDNEQHSQEEDETQEEELEEEQENDDDFNEDDNDDEGEDGDGDGDGDEDEDENEQFNISAQSSDGTGPMPMEEIADSTPNQLNGNNSLPQVLKSSAGRNLGVTVPVPVPVPTPLPVSLIAPDIPSSLQNQQILLNQMPSFQSSNPCSIGGMGMNAPRAPLNAFDFNLRNQFPSFAHMTTYFNNINNNNNNSTSNNNNNNSTNNNSSNVFTNNSYLGNDNMVFSLRDIDERLNSLYQRRMFLEDMIMKCNREKMLVEFQTMELQNDRLCILNSVGLNQASNPNSSTSNNVFGRTASSPISVIKSSPNFACSPRDQSSNLESFTLGGSASLQSSHIYCIPLENLIKASQEAALQTQYSGQGLAQQQIAALQSQGINQQTDTPSRAPTAVQIVGLTSPRTVNTPSSLQSQHPNQTQVVVEASNPSLPPSQSSEYQQSLPSQTVNLPQASIEAKSSSSPSPSSSVGCKSLCKKRKIRSNLPQRQSKRIKGIAGQKEKEKEKNQEIVKPVDQEESPLPVTQNSPSPSSQLNGTNDSPFEIQDDQEKELELALDEEENTLSKDRRDRKNHQCEIVSVFDLTNPPDKPQTPTSRSNPSSPKSPADDFPAGVLDLFDSSICQIRTIDKNILAAADTGMLYRINPRTKKVLDAHRIHTEAITHLYISQDSKHLYSVSLDGYLKKTSLVKNLATQELECNLQEPLQVIEVRWDMAFIGTRWGNIFPYKLKEDRVLPSLCPADRISITSLKATKEGPRKILIVASKGYVVYFRDAESGALLRTLTIPDNLFIYSIHLDNNHIYCGTQKNEVYKFDFHTGSLIRTMECGNGSITIKTVDDKLLVGCYDGYVYALNKETGELLRKVPAAGKMVLTMEVVGNKIICSSQNSKISIIPIP